MFDEESPEWEDELKKACENTSISVREKALEEGDGTIIYKFKGQIVKEDLKTGEITIFKE